MANNKKDKGKIFTKIMAVVLAVIMVLAFAGTLVYYLVSM